MTDRIVLCLLVRDEADIVADMLRWHLSQGVDHVIAMDNASADGTTEILEDFAAMGVLTRIAQPSDAYLQDVWATEMVRRAEAEQRADWVLLSDADEFWMPADPGRTLRDRLAAVPEDAAVVSCARRNLCAPWSEIEALGWRDALVWRPARPVALPPERVRDPAPLEGPFAYVDMSPKAIVRPGGVTRIGRGGHPDGIETTGRRSVLDAGIVVYHAPFRDRGEVAASIDRIGAAIAADPAAGPDISVKYRRWHAMAAGGRRDDALAEILPSPEALARDRLSGRVLADGRLRDAIAPRDAGAAARLALAGGDPGPDRAWLDPVAPPTVMLLAGGTKAARAVVARRLHEIGVRPIDDGVDGTARIAALLRAMGPDPSPALLVELRASQRMHVGDWHNLLLTAPPVAAALPVWRAMRAAGDLAPALVLLADAGADIDGAALERDSRDLPRLIAPADRIANAPPERLRAALSCLGVSVPVSIARASAPAGLAPGRPDPDLLRAGWGMGPA